MIQNLLQALERFKEEIDDNFIVGGSLALYQQGFECEPHDIDLELKTEDFDKICLLKALNSTYVGNEDSCRYPSIQNHYRFRFYGVMIDVWVVNEFDYKRFVYKDYIRYADVISVMKKKIALKREKDYKDLTNYANQITSLILKN